MRNWPKEIPSCLANRLNKKTKLDAVAIGAAWSVVHDWAHELNLKLPDDLDEAREKVRRWKEKQKKLDVTRERNDQIFEMLTYGRSKKDVATFFNISVSRVSEIEAQVTKKRRKNSSGI